MYPCTKFILFGKHEIPGRYSLKKNFEKINTKIVIGIEQCNWENVRFWDQICLRQLNGSVFQKINIKTILSRIIQCTTVLRFTQFGEYSIL